jgi:NifU-like protein
MWEYSDRVKELFLKPKNVGEVENPDAVGEVGSIACGDALKLTLKIDRDTERIIDARFQTFGCASAIASSSALTEMIKGKTVQEAGRITNQEIVDFLGGLPKEKMHCSVMGEEALQAALAEYLGTGHHAEPRERIVCKCFDISEEKIRRVAVENRLATVDEITDYTKAGGGCGSCRDQIEAILKSIWTQRDTPEPAKPAKLTNLRKIALIQEVLEREIRPRLQSDGGDLELLDIEGSKVIVGLRGMCVSCAMSDITLKGMEEKLRELVSDDIVVEAQ